MNVRRRALMLATGGLLGYPGFARSQAKRVARIGWLGLRDASSAAFEGLRAGLRERGWVEADNLVIETRIGGFEDAKALTAELLQARVELIVAQGGMIFRARPFAGTTPLIFQINGDPVDAKLVASYARPGGTMTGVTNLSAELSGKRVELLREVLPGMKRVAAIANQGHPGWNVELKATQAAAARFNLDLHWVPVFAPKDFETAFHSVRSAAPQGLLAIPDNLILNQAKAIADFSTQQGIAAISGWGDFAAAGNLMSYGPVLRDTYSKMAGYADRLLRGAKPGDLPVENPTRFEMVINLKVARALNLKVPQSMLVRADRVIE